MPGKLYTWGSSSFGALGNGTTTPNVLQPAQIGTGTTWFAISAGNRSTLGVRENGELWAWGHNSDSRLGDGSTTERTSPVRIGSASNWVFASVNGPDTATNGHALGLRSDGTIWGWGSNQYGQNGTGASRTSPTQIGSSLWASISAGLRFSVGIKTDGTLWSWGAAANGKLGNNTTTPDVLVPAQVGTDSNWLAVSAGQAHSLAIQTSGTLWAWGSGSSGRIGDGGTTQRNAPVQIGTATSWIGIAAGSTSSYGRRSDGTLWSWGGNAAGQLGDGGTTQKTSPAQVGTGSKWQLVSSKNDHVAAIEAGATIPTEGLVHWSSRTNSTTPSEGLVRWPRLTS